MNSIRLTITFGLLASIWAAWPTHARDVTYVGGGRYMCSGSDAECAPIRMRNDEINQREMERMRADREAEEGRRHFDESLRRERESRDRQERQTEERRFLERSISGD